MNTEKNIQELIEVCNAGAEGYNKAAEKVENDELKTLLNRLSQQRKLFAGELNDDLIKDMGEDRRNDIKSPSKIHRTIMDMKSLVTKNSDESIIEECKRGDNQAIELYSKMLDNNLLPEYILDKAVEHKKLIEGAINQINQFEEELSNA